MNISSLSKISFMKAENIASPVPWVLLLDAGVVLTNFFLIGFLSREMNEVVRLAWFEDDPEAGRLLGVALLATFIAQMIGAALKPAPMHARLRARRQQQPAGANQDERSQKKQAKWARLRVKDAATRYSTLFLILLFLHFVLSTLIVFSLPILLGVSYYWWTICLSILFMFVPTLLVAVALAPPKPDAPQPAGWRVHPLTETIANLGLFSYALINQIFWAGWLTPNAPLAGAGEIPMRVLQAFLFLIPVTMMYFFSTRILFLAEELDDPRTRLSMLLAVLSIVFRWVVGADAGKGSWMS